MDSTRVEPVARHRPVDLAIVERYAPWAVAGVALSVLSTAIATFDFIGSSDAGGADRGEWFVTIFIAVATAVLAFGMLYEVSARGAHQDSFAVGLGLLALAACAVFWSGVPIVLGVAAIAAGLEVLRRRTIGGERPRVAEAGMVMGALAVVLAMVFCVTG
jgi:hypothetical protein